MPTGPPPVLLKFPKALSFPDTVRLGLNDNDRNVGTSVTVLVVVVSKVVVVVVVAFDVVVLVVVEPDVATLVVVASDVVVVVSVVD